MARPTLKQTLGTDRDYNVVIRDSSGSAITTYTGSNALSSAIWAGDDQVALASPSLEWVDFTQGTATLTVSQNDQVDLEASTYRLLGWVAEDGGVKLLVLDVNLQLSPSPGSGTPPKRYGTSDQMKLYYPALDKLQADSDESGFVEQRSIARSWLDRVIASRWGGSYDAFSRFGQVNDRSYIQDLLDDDNLIVTPQVTEIVSKYALSVVLGSQLPTDNQVAAGRQSAYQQLGRQFRCEAENLVKTLVAELDTNADGQADLYIDLGTIKVRRD